MAFLLGFAAVAGLLSAEGHTLAMLVDAFSMVVPPLTVKAGNRLASRLRAMPASAETAPANMLNRHAMSDTGPSEQGITRRTEHA